MITEIDQENCPDYYDSEEDGCCLNCENAKDGCLCFECKCTKCYWYRKDDNNENGYCELPIIWKNKRESKLKKYKSTFIDYSRVGLSNEQRQIGDFK